MYRIKLAKTVLTKAYNSLSMAKYVRKELHKHYFSDCDISELTIVDDNGNVVNDYDNRIKTIRKGSV